MKFIATFVAGGAAATALLVGDSIAAAKNQVSKRDKPER